MKRPMTKEETLMRVFYSIKKEMLNHHGILHGGELFKMMDSVSGMVSERYSGERTITKAVNSFSFSAPSREGDTILVKAVIDYVGKTSMDVYAKAYRNGEEEEHVVGTGYFTMVAVDENFRPRAVPPLELNSDQDRRYAQKAKQRRLLIQRIEEGKE